MKYNIDYFNDICYYCNAVFISKEGRKRILIAVKTLKNRAKKYYLDGSLNPNDYVYLLGWLEEARKIAINS